MIINTHELVINCRELNQSRQGIITFHVEVGPSLDLVDGDRVLAHVLVHRLLDGELVDGQLSALILQHLDLVLLALEDLLAFEAPLGLLVGSAEGGGEDHLLVLQLLDALVLQGDHPLVGFLK